MPLCITIKRGEGLKIARQIEIFYHKNRGRETISLMVFAPDEMKFERIERNESEKYIPVDHPSRLGLSNPGHRADSIPGPDPHTIDEQ